MTLHEENMVHTRPPPGNMEALKVKVDMQRVVGKHANYESSRRTPGPHTGLTPSNIEKQRMRVEEQRAAGKQADHESI